MPDHKMGTAKVPAVPPSTSTGVKLGIIGFGIMGERLLRSALEQDLDLLQVVGVWDPSAAAGQRLAAALPRVPRLADAQAVITAADCVYLASPPATHLDYARAALAEGRAVFSEKPLAVDLEDARVFSAAVEADGLRAAVNFVLASSPAVNQLRAWRDGGLVGTAKSLEIEVGFAQWPRPWQSDAAGWLGKRDQGGFTREVISHFLFLSRRLLGPLVLLEGQATFPPGDASETLVRARLTAGGLPVTLDGAVGSTEKPDHNIWMLEGDRGAIRLRDWSIAERRLANGAWAEAPHAIANEVGRPLVLARQLAKVIRMTRGETQDLATVREALEVQEIVEAILAG